jgi:hypothetical protein
MTLKSLLVRALLIGVMLMPAAAALGSSGTASPGAVIATSKKPGRYCLDIDAATRDAIRRGEKRLVVAVHAFQPATPPSAGLVVSLLTGNKSRKHEISQFAIHPLRAFSAEEAGKQQNFLVSLEEYGHLLAEKEPLCIELGFDASRGKLMGGFAEFHIEWVDITATPKK